MRRIHVCVFGNTREIRTAATVAFDPLIEICHVGGEADSGWSNVERSALIRHHPQVMVLDIESPLSPTIFFWMRQHLPETGLILIMTVASTTGICLLELMAKGIKGAVHGSALMDELPKAIMAVIQGGMWFPPVLLETLHKELDRDNETANQPHFKGMLSKRQIEIMELVLKGFSNKRIAEKLMLSEYTVPGHFKEIFRKLAVHNRPEAISKLFKLNSNVLRETESANENVQCKTNGLPVPPPPPINMGDDILLYNDRLSQMFWFVLAFYGCLLLKSTGK